MRAFLLVLCSLALGAADMRGPAYLGITFDDAATSFAGEGMVILRIEPASPAAIMGLTSGDRLVALDGNPLRLHDDWSRHFTAKRAGDAITLTAIRAPTPGTPGPTLTVTGILPEPPPQRRDSLSAQLAAIEQRLARLDNEAREPTLVDLLKQLRDLERDLPRAAAAFKRIYPQGEFRLVLSLELTSDKTAAEPLAIEVGGAAASTKPTPAPELKPDPLPAR